MGDPPPTKVFIDFACSTLSDENTLALARYLTMDPGGNAQLHLDAYLKGTGIDMKVNLSKVLVDDDGVREEVTREIMLAVQKGRTSGSVAIPQSKYSNHDWQFAIGSMNINWSVVPGTTKYRLNFRNKYRWHPNEARQTQCVHKAAENLKLKGAKDYWMYGDAVVEIATEDNVSKGWSNFKNPILKVLSSPL